MVSYFSAPHLYWGGDVVFAVLWLSLEIFFNFYFFTENVKKTGLLVLCLIGLLVLCLIN